MHDFSSAILSCREHRAFFAFVHEARCLIPSPERVFALSEAKISLRSALAARDRPPFKMHTVHRRKKCTVPFWKFFRLHGVSGQPRHGQDHGGTRRGQNLQGGRRPLQGAPGGGLPPGPGLRAHRRHRAQDQGRGAKCARAFFAEQQSRNAKAFGNGRGVRGRGCCVPACVRAARAAVRVAVR